MVVSRDDCVQVIEHVAAALGKDPQDVKQLNFLKPPEQVQAALTECPPAEFQTERCSLLRRHLNPMTRRQHYVAVMLCYTVLYPCPFVMVRSSTRHPRCLAEAPVIFHTCGFWHRACSQKLKT